MNSQTVLVTVRASTRKTYHTDPDCKHVGEHHRPIDREIADEWGIPCCKRCAGEFEFGGVTDQDRSIYEAAKAHGEQGGEDDG